MTSACIFKDTLRNHTLVFLKFTDSIIEVCLHLIKLNCTLDSYLSVTLNSGAGTSNKIPLQESGFALPAILITLSIFIYWNQLLQQKLFDLFFFIRYVIKYLAWFYRLWCVLCRTDIKWTQSATKKLAGHIKLNRAIGASRNKDAINLYDCIPSTLYFKINDDSNEPTIRYRFGRQLPIVPPSLNDLNLPPHPFNILATMALANNTEDANDNIYSPESPEPSELSPISTPPRNVSAFNSWETSYTTTNDDTFYSSDEPRRIHFLPPTPSPPSSPPRKMKRRLSLGM